MSRIGLYKYKSSVSTEKHDHMYSVLNKILSDKILRELEKKEDRYGIFNSVMSNKNSANTEIQEDLSGDLNSVV